MKESSDLRDHIIIASAGLMAGCITKLVLRRLIKSQARQLFATVLLLGITNMLTRHPDTVRAVGKGVFKSVRHWSGRRE